MSAFKQLLDWYSKKGRILPWREKKDPYRVFISEMMLQQTQVDHVLDFYARWIEQFPDWQTLAKAPRSTILRAWNGLGYNRRALFIQAAAQTILLQGFVPTNETAWRLLKGVGPYAAAAISAFAYNQRTIVIDTNISRVMGRVFLGIPFPEPLHRDAIAVILDKKMPKKQWTSDIYQALMDLGAVICSVRNPSCASCPWKRRCKARIPLKTALPPKKKIQERIHLGKKFPDRIYRGKILCALLDSPGLSELQIAKRIDPTYAPSDKPWIASILQRLQREEFLIRRGKKFFLS